MEQVTIIGLDLAKNVFQANGASETGMLIDGWQTLDKPIEPMTLDLAA